MRVSVPQKVDDYIALVAQVKFLSSFPQIDLSAMSMTFQKVQKVRAGEK